MLFYLYPQGATTLHVDFTIEVLVSFFEEIAMLGEMATGIRKITKGILGEITIVEEVEIEVAGVGMGTLLDKLQCLETIGARVVPLLLSHTENMGMEVVEGAVVVVVDLDVGAVTTMDSLADEILIVLQDQTEGKNR